MERVGDFIFLFLHEVVFSSRPTPTILLLPFGLGSLTIESTRITNLIGACDRHVIQA